MNRPILLPALALAVFASPLAAAPGGDLGTLPTGRYACEMPGDATGPVGRRVPEADFTVLTASSYRTQGVIGSYLLTGDVLRMTSGPLRGRRYHRIRSNFLRVIDADGRDGRMRCVRPKNLR